MLFNSPSLKLTETALVDELGSISIDDRPDHQPVSTLRLKGATPLMEKLWRCALYDFESNRCTSDLGEYFAAGGRGQGWSGIIFPRDLAYAGLPGLNDLAPR
jgi:hypothetical protein